MEMDEEIKDFIDEGKQEVLNDLQLKKEEF